MGPEWVAIIGLVALFVVGSIGCALAPAGIDEPLVVGEVAQRFAAGRPVRVAGTSIRG